jgi:hypothetical protein
MRLSLGLLLVGSVALAACSGEDGGGIRRNGTATGPTANPDDVTPPPGGPAGPAAIACPATVAAPTALSTVDTNATDVHVIPGFVIYREGNKIVRVDPKGAGRTELYTSADLVHSYADETVIVTVESPDAPDAILKVMPVGGPGGDKLDPANAGAEIVVTPPTPWSAGGTYVFASDAVSFYVLADVTNQGDTIYKLDKANPQAMTALATFPGSSLGDPQLSGTDVWFVRDQKRVYKVTQDVAGDPNVDKIPGAVTASPPTEVFGIEYANCKLAVGGNHTFCSTGKALEQRDLTGANLTTVYDTQKGMPTLLGAAMFGADSVFVRSLPSSPTDALKNGIHAIKGTEDKLVACGRETINAFTVASSTVVWAEQGKGVFSAPR